MHAFTLMPLSLCWPLGYQKYFRQENDFCLQPRRALQVFLLFCLLIPNVVLVFDNWVISNCRSSYLTLQGSWQLSVASVSFSGWLSTFVLSNSLKSMFLNHHTPFVILSSKFSHSSLLSDCCWKSMYNVHVDSKHLYFWVVDSKAWT